MIGEIATALVTVHECGFVYGDLKPENVLITATRHMKLADFGACRAFTAIAKVGLIDSRNALREMRSGDWKADLAAHPSLDLSLKDNDDSLVSPKNFEGTTLYLPPEAVGEGYSSVLSDAYALGMTTYFVSRGRLPQWADHSGTDSSRKVVLVAGSIPTDDFFKSTSSELANFITSLVNHEIDLRMSVQEAVMNAPWFVPVQDVRKLYLKQFNGSSHLVGAAESSTGSSKEPGDWEKRQLSKIWTAQPSNYDDFGSACNDDAWEEGSIPETDLERFTAFI